MRAKDFIPPSKPRNPVVRQQQTSGAGAHRDKKKEQKQGYEKHKGKGVSEGQLDESMFSNIEQLVDRFYQENDIDPSQQKLEIRNPGTRVWTRFDGARHRDPGRILSKDPQLMTGFWEWFKTQPGVRPMDSVRGAYMSSDYDEAVSYKGAYFAMTKDGYMVYGSMKRVTNPKSVWLQKQDEGVSEGSYTTEKQILTRIRQIMYDRKLSGTESNAGELHRLKQQLKDIRSQQGVSEGFFSIDSSTKGKIQNIVSDLSDIPGMWDHKAQTFTDAGMDKLKVVLKNNPKYIKYAVKLTADDFDESVEEGWGQKEFEVDGYTYITDIDEEEDNRKIWHMLKTPEGETINVDFTPYAYMSKDDVELYIKLGMPERRGVGPLDTEQLQKMAQIKGVAMLDPKMAKAGL